MNAGEVRISQAHVRCAASPAKIHYKLHGGWQHVTKFTFHAKGFSVYHSRGEAVRWEVVSNGEKLPLLAKPIDAFNK